MWRNLLGCVLLLLATPMSRAAERFLKQELASRFPGAPRPVQIYLPPSYHSESYRRYPVLYLHDGQNVFSSAGTNVCFGWGNWELDKTVDELCQAGKMQEIILVAVHNTSARYGEYCGRHHAAEPGTNTEFENYEAFLVQELKPKIDSLFRTLPDSANTGVMGSSLGGICSIVLAWDHPEIFGRAASLSGAFQVEGTNFLNQILRLCQGKPKPTRLYLDSGTIDFTGGDDGHKLSSAVSDEFLRMGWGKSLMHYVDAKPLTVSELEKSGLRRDKWAEAQTSQHNEFYWRLRVWRALTFLFPPATNMR
jgi:predicted alpha/beta superfamily hydrolase